MRINTTICNMCGKTFDKWDEQESFGIHENVGYGSKHDGDIINLDMCCDCFDKLIDNYILPQCYQSPIEDTDRQKGELE